MQRDPRSTTPPAAETSRPVDEAAASEAPPQARRFERPRVRRLGALPAVTTAFGGSFTP